MSETTPRMVVKTADPQTTNRGDQMNATRGAGEPLFDARDSDMRDWPDDELTVGALVGTLKDMGRDDDPFVVTTEAGARVRLLGVRRIEPVGAVDLVVETPEPVLSYADLKVIAAGDPAAVKATTDLAGQLFCVRGILARVLESETASRQMALEDIARILGE